MTFTLPVAPADVASYLRELEANAPKTTQREIRDALIAAAQDIETSRKVREDAARVLDEAATVRISQMATTSQADEIQRGVKRTLIEVAARLRA